MIKTLIFLRHGQYQTKPTEKLTALGRKQAQLAGRRLGEFKINKIYVSTMPRAIETSKIVLKKFSRLLKPESCDLLQECVPGFPLKLRKIYGHTNLAKLKKGKAQADKAYKKYFTFSKKMRTELLVCHGNIIRYFVCKALGVDTDTWVKLDIKQCGITIIILDSENNSVSLITHNDIGHIPVKMQTFI